jgi:hypothetical protein
MDTRKRNTNGTFQKGQPPPKEAHRQRGVTNKITTDIKAGAIAGFARHGSNGRGEGGFAGFCYFLAKKHPKAAVRIIEKLLPLQVNASGMGDNRITTVNVVSIPTDTFLSRDQIAQLQPRLALDHAPLAEGPAPTAEFVPQTERKRELLSELEKLTPEELLERAKQAGYIDVDAS